MMSTSAATANITMPTRPLGHSGLHVPLICLGTMTWGEQNNQEDGFAQMDEALAMGVNFWDTAEVYAVPIRQETYGKTETIIGHYLAEHQNRQDIILATKASGPNPSWKWIRKGKIGFDENSLRTALDDSLNRLQTDYVDLYQLHWPERNVPIFGQREYVHRPQQDNFNFIETLTTLKALMAEGKIKHWGLSNETPWGVMKYVALAEAHGLPKPVSVQNCYNILNRTLEVSLSEVLLRENISLLPYSPLAMGLLSGKYLDGPGPADGRLNLFGDYFSRYKSHKALEATRLYQALAEKHGMSLTHLALAYVNQQPFVASNIIGATKLPQLRENISSMTAVLSDSLMKELNAIHDEMPNPCP
jgi:aryl-alcohol dehydrogenase-like predicted oxidoreductase